MDWLIPNDKYTPWEFFWVFGGFLLWAVAYVILVRTIHKTKFVEMPFAVATGNIAWEILWSFGFAADLRAELGFVNMILYQIGTLLDVYIFVALLRYGIKQINDPGPTLEKLWRPMILLITFGWGLLFYLLKTGNYDSAFGTVSAMGLNLVISPLYIAHFRTSRYKVNFSYSVAWLKMLGTGMVTVFAFLRYPNTHDLGFHHNAFILAVGVFIFIFDSIYVTMFTRWRARQARA